MQTDSKAELIDLTDLDTDRTYSRRIALHSEQVAAHLWEEILNRTNDTGNEHGLIVSHDNRKKVFKPSKIYKGNKTSISKPFFPHGFESWKYITSLEDIVNIHAHPTTEDNAHLATTGFSQEDWENYLADEQPKIMIDHGGIHLLLGLPQIPEKNERFEVVKSALLKAKTKIRNGEDQYIHDILSDIADHLDPYNVRYFYSNQLKPENNRIEFVDVRDAENLKQKNKQ